MSLSRAGLHHPRRHLKRARPTAAREAPTAVNTLRLIAKAGKLTMILNGTQLKVIRAQVPDGALRFSVYGQIDKAAENVPPIRVKSFKVTAGE